MNEDQYRTAYGFMEGWMNVHFKVSDIFTHQDRLVMLRALKHATSLEPIGSELKEAVNGTPLRSILESRRLTQTEKR